MAHYQKKVKADKLRELDEYDHEEFLRDKDFIMGAYWLNGGEPEPDEIETLCEEARRFA